MITEYYYIGGLFLALTLLLVYRVWRKSKQLSEQPKGMVGGVVTINQDGTLNITAGRGWLVDCESYPGNPTTKYIQWDDIKNIPINTTRENDDE